MGAGRTYGERCSVAHALDLVGERWALLVVRELLLGPKRFTDLRGGLPHAGPNVLSQRVRDLERVGVVRRHKLPPPASSWVYELTDWGHELGPVVTALARWGVRSPFIPAAATIGVDSVVLGLRTFYDPGIDDGPDVAYQLRLGEDRFRIQIADGRLTVERGEATRAGTDAVIETDTATFDALLGRPEDLAAAVDAGKVHVTGNPDAAERLLRTVSMPLPAPTPSPGGARNNR